MLAPTHQSRRTVLAVAVLGAALFAMLRPTPAVAQAPASSTAAPAVELEEAIARARRFDPAVVDASGRVANAAWLRRSARAALFLPSVSADADATGFSAPAFNIGTLSPANRVVTSQIRASYEVHLGGRQIALVRRANSAAESAIALEAGARYASARAATLDYYAVVSARELRGVAVERVQRAEAQLRVARARVALGAVVQTDSLQALLELTRAKTELMEREAALHVARLQLGRRIGVAGPVDAAGRDSLPTTLPLALEVAVTQAVERGPAFVAARAEERAAESVVTAERSAYMPKVTVTAAAGAFDQVFFPRAAYRSQLGIAVSLPIWDNGARELAFAQARVARDAARARRQDLDRGAAQTVAAAYTGYTTAHASIDLGRTERAVAHENYRVQSVRYAAGAASILDVLEAQGALSRAEADVVQARRRARLALAELEFILADRLTPAPAGPSPE